MWDFAFPCILCRPDTSPSPPSPLPLFGCSLWKYRFRHCYPRPVPRNVRPPHRDLPPVTPQTSHLLPRNPPSPPLSLRDLLSRPLSPGPALPRTHTLSHSEPFAVSRPPSPYRLTCSRFPGAVSAASIVRLSNFPLILVSSFHSVFTRLS